MIPQLTVPLLPPIQGTPSCVIKIINMFDPATETEPGWELDIKEDTEQECTKFGPVLFSHVETVQPGGIVYIVFADNDSAVKASGFLHGRWFAGRTITIEYMQPIEFVGLFPAAKKAVEQAGGM
jgi:RNA-binding protein 23/39